MFSREIVEKVGEEFKLKRSAAEARQSAKKAEIRAKIAEYADIEKEMASFGMKLFSVAVEGGEDREAKMEEIKEHNRSLQARLKELLLQNGYPEDYLDIHYECDKCSDSGYVGMKMCDCYRRALAREGYRSSGLGKLIQRQTFDSFDLGVFSERALDSKRSPREEMEEIFNSCKEYAASFSLSSPSLLFIGGTGLGKTHLSSAIAGVVIDKGFDVVYDSVPNIVLTAEKERFREVTEDSKMQRYFNADLLIMDDLGTEAVSKSSQSVIYNIINTRALVNSLPTIISTNLSYKSLEQLYDSPVVSRLFGEFEVSLFRGEDFRRISLL